VEDKLVKSLIDVYTKNGLDLTSLINEPLFAQLPLEKKVSVIRKYASIITSNSSRGLSKNDIKSLLFAAGKGAAWGGGMGAWGAYQAFKGFEKYTPGAAAKPIATAALTAAGLGAAGAALRAFVNNSNKRTRLDMLDQVQADGSDENIIKLLIHNGSLPKLQPGYAMQEPLELLNRNYKDQIWNRAKNRTAVATLAKTFDRHEENHPKGSAELNAIVDQNSEEAQLLRAKVMQDFAAHKTSIVDRVIPVTSRNILDKVEDLQAKFMANLQMTHGLDSKANWIANTLHELKEKG